ncbi:siphovirus Gp157 family protein, partial [Neisseria gonorrhoeae]
MTALTLYRCAADVQAALDYYFDSETEREDTLEAV